MEDDKYTKIISRIQQLESKNNHISELNSTSTTLYTSIENKIEELNSKKELLLIKRNKIFNSLSCRFFSLGKDKINLIDIELDRIEEEIYCLRRP